MWAGTDTRQYLPSTNRNPSSLNGQMSLTNEQLPSESWRNMSWLGRAKVRDTVKIAT